MNLQKPNIALRRLINIVDWTLANETQNVTNNWSGKNEEMKRDCLADDLDY